MTWKERIRTHMEVLVATDFFTAEVWTLGGLVTYDVLFCIHLGSRQVHVAGVTPHPNEAWIVDIIGFNQSRASSAHRMRRTGDDNSRGDCASRTQSP